MKKKIFFALQIVSMFLFVLLLSGVYGIIDEVINSKEDFAFNLGYGVGSVLVFCFLFWLNIKLYKYTSKANDK